MSCYFDANGSLIMRRGDTAVFSIESDDIPFEEYDKAYFAIIDRETLQPVLPELYVDTDNTRRVEFMFTVEQTETLPQPVGDYTLYGYTFKLCTDDGIEDTFIPQVTKSGSTLVVSKIPKVLFYPKVIEGLLPPTP